MKQIPLTQGQFAMVDDEDFKELMKYKWNANKSHAAYYATRASKYNESTKMHRCVMGDIKGVCYDHIDGNGLNNQKSNLRVATNTQNAMNRKKRSNCVSKYKGVCWMVKIGKWLVRIMHNHKAIRIGLYFNEEEAARAYDAKAIELFGEYARLNFPTQYRSVTVFEKEKK